jgi:GTP-binding protein
VIVAANKAEGRGGEAGRLEAYALGLGDPIAISAEHGEGVVDLFEALRPLIESDEDGPHADPLQPAGDEEEEELGPLKLAIVGRPNAGKSTLVNRMLGEERMITGPEAGITRDSVSVEWDWQGRKVRLVDTAGLRKKAKVDDKLERLSAADARRAIDRSEVVLLLLDATRGLEVQDLKIADATIEEGRVLLIAVNKWDVADNASSLFNGIKAALEEGLSQLKGVPLLTVSARTGKGIDAILKAAFELREAWSRRVGTGELNRWFEQAVEANPPPAPKGKRIKLRYITQVKTRPPSFVVFGNRTDELPDSYRRYLVNAMRRDLKLGPVPLRLTFRGSRNPFDTAPSKLDRGK